MQRPPEELEALRAILRLVKEKYHLSDEALQAELFSASIPATIFTATSTPLESVVSYLAAQNMPAKDIAKALGRTTTYVRTISERGRKHEEPHSTPYRIPLSVINGGAAGTRIVAYLASRGLSDKEIAALLHKDTSTIWTWRTRGERT